MRWLAEEIRATLDKTGKSQKYLAQKVGVTEGTISRIMIGADPRLSVSQRILTALEEIKREHEHAAQ